jgi:hypothetical protein
MPELRRQPGALDTRPCCDAVLGIRGAGVSLARIAVFFLRLASLGGILFSGILIAVPFLMPEEIPLAARNVFSPGCFSCLFAVVFLPLSLIPAGIAWAIQERIVGPQQMAEKSWRDGALSREERLWLWIGYLANLQVRHRSLRHSPNDPVPGVLQAEIPRALRELDPGRRARLIRFLQEAGFAEDLKAAGVSTESGVMETGLERRLPRRDLVSLAAGTFAIFSGFFVFWCGLAVFTLIFANPLRTVGMSDGRMVELVPVLYVLLTLALLCGLASAGLRKLYRQAVRALEKGEDDGETRQGIALKSIQEQMEELPQLSKVGDLEEGVIARKIVRAMAVITASELDGQNRAKLVRLLYDSGWLRGGGPVPANGLNLRVAELGGENLSEICLSGADLSGADLNGADLTGADLSRCSLCGSDLRSAQLKGANLHGADLRYSRLQRADLERADLRAVVLDNANFWGANLLGIELSGAQGNAEYLVLSGKSA